MNEYTAKVLRVIDTDTIECAIELGFDVIKHEKIRLARINALEKNESKKVGEKILTGKMGTSFTAAQCAKHQNIVKLKVYQHRGKYGRTIANVYLGTSDICLNDLLVIKGYAIRKNY